MYRKKMMFVAYWEHVEEKITSLYTRVGESFEMEAT